MKRTSLPRKRSAYSIVFILLSVLYLANNGSAYYHTDKLAKTIYFESVRGNSVHGKGEDVSVLYDNLDGTSSGTISRPIIHAGSKNFVPAEVIDCNIPIRIAVLHPVTPGNSLAELLYADLKLKKLYEEKKALVLRTQEILAGLSVPFVEYILPSRPLTSSGFSVHQKTEELQRNYRAVRNSIQLSAFRSYKVDSLTLSNPDSWTTLDMTQRRAERMRMASAKSVMGEKKVLTNGAEPSHEGTNRGAVQPNTPRQQEKKLLNQNKTDIPWIFRIFIKFQELVFSSPREVIISLLIVAFLISMLFSGKRR